MAIVVFEQGRPYAATDPWYEQTFVKYRVRADGFKKLWQQSSQVHAINFVPTHELAQRMQNGSRPRPPVAGRPAK